MKALALALLVATTAHAQFAPAVGVGVIRDGKLREVRITGDVIAGQPAPYDTIFNVASLTKPVVAMVTLRLVADGQWDLDEPLARYWVDPDVATDPRHRTLTTRHVLAHQTGFKNWRWLDEGEKLRFPLRSGHEASVFGRRLRVSAPRAREKVRRPADRAVAQIRLRSRGHAQHAARVGRAHRRVAIRAVARRERRACVSEASHHACERGR